MERLTKSSAVGYDLEERLVVFAEKTATVLKKIKITPLNSRVVDQLMGSVGSSGANYCEANEAESRKDFIHKAKITKKELKESKHWLRILATLHPELKEEVRLLWKEAHELVHIFSKITRKKIDEN